MVSNSKLGWNCKRAATDTNGFPNSTPTAAIMISDDMSAAAAAAPWSEAAGLSSEHQASSVDMSAATAVRANAASLQARNCFTAAADMKQEEEATLLIQVHQLAWRMKRKRCRRAYGGRALVL